MRSDVHAISPALARVVLVVTIVSAIAGCSTATAVWSLTPAPGGASSPVRIFVVNPAVEIGAHTGNIGQDFSEVQRAVKARILGIVREVDPAAEVADSTGDSPFQPMARYIEAVAPARTTREEINAAGYAVQHGATGLLVPTIVEWRETRTDDPIGALATPHNRVAIALRFVRLNPVGLLGSVTFQNQARVTLNQAAGRLLNDEFRKTVLQLLRSGARG